MQRRIDYKRLLGGIMWEIFWGLLNRDKGKLLLTVLLYFLAMCFIPLDTSLFLAICLLILTRNVWYVIEIYYLIPLVISYALIGLLLMFAPTLLAPNAIGSALVGFVLVLQKLLLINDISQMLCVFFVLVSAWYNVGFLRSCVYSIKYHLGKLLVFLLFLLPWGMYKYSFLTLPNSAAAEGVAQGSIFLKGAIMIWVGLLAPYIMSAWLIAKPVVPAQPKTAAPEQEQPLVKTAPALPDTASFPLLPAAGTLYSVFFDLLKRDKVPLVCVFILFIALVGVFPQWTLVSSCVFSGIFLAILTKRFWVVCITPLIAIGWVLFSKASATISLLAFFPQTVSFIRIAFGGILLLTPLAACIASWQHKNIFQAYGLVLSRHLKKGLLSALFLGIPLFYLLGELHSGNAAHLPKLFFITALSGLWLFILVPYMMAAWLKISPKTLRKIKKVVPAPKPVSAGRSAPIPAVQIQKAFSVAVAKKGSVKEYRKIFDILLSRDVEQFKNELKAHPELANVVWPDTGNTLLHVAALNDWEEEIQVLLEADAAACCARNKQGKSPADLAEERGYNELAAYLRQKENLL